MPEATEEPVDWIPERCDNTVAGADDAADEVLEDTETCFHCGQAGRLILCDRVKCGRMYHLTCIGVRRLPHGLFPSVVIPYLLLLPPIEYPLPSDRQHLNYDGCLEVRGRLSELFCIVLHT